MNITTKFDIGQIIKFKKVTEYVGKDKAPTEETHVGIIEKVLISSNGISYLMKSSYQSWVDEANIVCVLTEK